MEEVYRSRNKRGCSAHPKLCTLEPLIRDKNGGVSSSAKPDTHKLSNQVRGLGLSGMCSMIFLSGQMLSKSNPLRSALGALPPAEARD